MGKYLPVKDLFEIVHPQQLASFSLLQSFILANFAAADANLLLGNNVSQLCCPLIGLKSQAIWQ